MARSPRATSTPPGTSLSVGHSRPASGTSANSRRTKPSSAGHLAHLAPEAGLPPMPGAQARMPALLEAEPDHPACASCRWPIRTPSRSLGLILLVDEGVGRRDPYLWFESISHRHDFRSRDYIRICVKVDGKEGVWRFIAGRPRRPSPPIRSTRCASRSRSAANLSRRKFSPTSAMRGCWTAGRSS